MAELQPSPVLRMPQVTLAEEMDSPLPLEHTQVTVQITGPLATVAVAQRFGNPLDEPAELDYLFPLPEEAAITGFELVIGERRILGDLQEREQARAAYDEASSQGKRAGLFEQRRPNLFAVRLANVRPGETIQATIRYQQRLKFEDDARGGAYEFVFPMGITPQYDSPQHPGEGEGVHAPIARGELVGVVEIDLAADAGLPAGDVTSPSHDIEVTWLDDRRFQVRLPGEQIPDHDFVLRYAPARQQPGAACWTSGEPGKAFFLATLIPQWMETDVVPRPRAFIFVLDRSGSMRGQPIRQARNALRACLRTLNAGDTFSMLLFDDRMEWYAPEPAQVTQETVDRADTFLSGVDGRGGTEIVGALEAVLALPADPARTRYIVFLTDGAVSAEARLLDGLRKRIGAARVFTFGIGPSVNRALLNRMASFGRGRATFLQLDEDIEGAIIRFQDSISFPALTDLALEWSGGKAWGIFPARLPDLYAGQPLEICGRLALSGSAPAHLTVRGLRDGQPVEMVLSLPAQPGNEPAIERLWARAKVDDLLDQAELDPASAEKIRAEALGLALEFDLVTMLTSFVAIEPASADANRGKPRRIHVAQPLPQGLYPAAFAPGVQQVAFMASIAPRRLASPGAAPSMPAAQADMLSFSPPEDLQSVRPIGRASTKAMNDHRPVGYDTTDDRPTDPRDPEAVLRWLARTQAVDGSWKGDMEMTAAALLAFVRAGQTTRAGTYRQVVRRAAGWLDRSTAAGEAMFFRACALDELARATGHAVERRAAERAKQALPAAKTPLEAAAAGQATPPLEGIRDMEDLRLAGVLGLRLPLPAALLAGPGADLALAWAGTLNPSRA